MKLHHRLNALIIDADIASRSILKELVHHEQSFGYPVYRGVYLAESLKEGMTALLRKKSIDVIFISRNFSHESIAEFIENAKRAEGPRGVAYVLVATREGESQLSLATGIVEGGDGIVVKPCSVFDLREVTEIALRIQIEAQEKLAEAALSMMVSSMLSEIESCVAEFYQTSTVTPYRRHLKSATRTLLKGSRENLEKYYEILARKCAEIEPTINAFYSGKSQRVKARILRRLRNANASASNSSVTAEIIEALESGKLDIPGK